jgi:integrase
MDIHHSDEKINKALNKLKKDKKITERNKELIMDFLDYLFVENLSRSRILKYLYILKQSVKIFNKDFDKISKKDVTHFYKYINTNDDYEEWTKHDYKVLTRRFYQWIQKKVNIKSDETREAIDEICKKEIKRAKSREKRPEHLITGEEVRRIGEHTLNSRDNALVLGLYESACRIGEILPIRIKDVEFDKYGCIMSITGKTGARKVRLCASAPALANWKENHPDKTNPDAFFFCGIGQNNYKKMLSYVAARKVVFEAAQRAGIKKRVNLHKFRASRATQLVIEGMSEPVLCKFGGWEIGSSEIRTYVKLADKDVEDEILRINGLLKEEDKGNGFKMLICPRCKVRNEPGSRFCHGCSLGLDEKSVMEYDAHKNLATQMGFADLEMLKNPKFREFYNDMLALTWEKYKKMQKTK